MPCHRARDASALPVSAAGDLLSPSGVAVSRVATERARPACPERGGRDFSRNETHALPQQSLRPVLSGETVSGHAFSHPSRLEQRLAALAIVAVGVGVPVLLARGWPLTLLIGGGQ
jgi:hypothetical protein